MGPRKGQKADSSSVGVGAGLSDVPVWPSYVFLWLPSWLVGWLVPLPVLVLILLCSLW